MDQRFEVLESDVSCSECGRETRVVFDGKRICGHCAGVWNHAQRAAFRKAMLTPYVQYKRSPNAKSSEDRYKAAPKSEIETEEDGAAKPKPFGS